MEKALEFVNLSKSFGNIKAVDNLSFQVRQGEIFGFVGSNGAGKSTTMRIALGVLTPDSGEVKWAGKPVDGNIRKRIGYMPEERGLYPRMRVGEQLSYFAKLHGLPTPEATRAMENWTYQLGLLERRGDAVQKLSLGNQQRVQLAAALIHSPEILILDEPFSGLDPVAVDVMSRILREQADAGKPVIFSSHQLELVERLCDRVGIIKKGNLIASGTIDEVGGSSNSWTLSAANTSPLWLSAIPGIAITAQKENTFVFRADPASAQVALRAALEQGPVGEFKAVKPSLTELFKNVVQEPEPKLNASVEK